MRKYEIGGSTDFFNKLADEALSQFDDQSAVDMQVGTEDTPTDDTENQQDDTALYGQADISPEQDYEQLQSDYNDLQAKYDDLQTSKDFVPSGSFDDGFMNYLFEDRNKMPIEFDNTPPEEEHGVRGTINSIINTVKEAVGKFDITSQFRSPEHNREVGGKPNSFHLTGQAVDIAPNEKVNKYFTSTAGKEALKEQGYEIIDERNRKGHGAHWHLEPINR